jgi:hypothetical protein
MDEYLRSTTTFGQKAAILKLIRLGLYRPIRDTGGMLCGGALTSLFSSTDIHDFDLYFKSRGLIKSFERDLRDAEVWTIQHSSTNATTWHNKKGIKVQIIQRPDLILEHACRVLDTFDFSVCSAGLDLESGVLWYHPHFFEDLKNKNLRYNLKAPAPINALKRVVKYVSRGFAISEEELNKIESRVDKHFLADQALLTKELGGMYDVKSTELLDAINQYIRMSERGLTARELLTIFKAHQNWKERL